MRTLALLLLIGCSGDVAEEPRRLADGETCNANADCESRACAPVLPVDPRGVCFGPGLGRCIRVLVSAWASDECAAVGMAVALCGPDLSQDVKDRCITQAVPASQYPYTCCETTLFE